MSELLQHSLEATDPNEMTARVLGVHPLRVVRQSLSNSGKAVYRVDLPDDQSVVLRTSERPATFTYTRRNLDLLRALRLPVPTVLACGRTASGGSYVILNWIPGKDLVHELPYMTRPQISLLAEQVVECQRRVGRLPPAQHFGWAPIGHDGPLTSWSQVFGDPADPIQIDDGSFLGGLRSRLCALRARVEPYFSTVRASPFLDDLTTKNVLIENGELRGFIDIDFVCYGDPLLAVGATLASLAAEAPESAKFYGEELVRFWNPTPSQQLAIWFYAALWAIGSLALTDPTAEPARGKAFSRAAKSWLARAEADQTLQVTGMSTLDLPRVEDSPIPATPELEQHLNRVEYYQPLYGITGFEPPLRCCRDRALTIESALAPLGKKFRLIDFGSSLGYFPFFFADRGAVATGFDIRAQNTAVAVATQHLNGLPATFKTAPLDLPTVLAIPPEDYDVALLLSVLHHITHRYGLDYVANLLAELLARIPTLILELAHRDEAVSFAWRDSLPEEPLAILSACGNVNVRTIAHFPSHLSGATRPMFLVTR